MVIVYSYGMNDSFKFRLSAIFGYDLYFFEKSKITKEVDAALVDTITFMPQISYNINSHWSLAAGPVALIPSKMEVPGPIGYIPVDPNAGFGYSVGLNYTTEISPKLSFSGSASYLNVNRSTKTISDQVNEQVHATFSFVYKVD